MLIEFSVENFRSFRDRVTLNLRTGTIKEFSETHTSELKKERLVKSAVIYGANASGKSNLIRALGFMRKMVLEFSKRSQSQERIPIEPYRLNEGNYIKPSSFEIVFSIDDAIYRYGFRLDAARIYAEWLFTVVNVKEVSLFLREQQDFDIKPRFKEGKGLEEKTRQNALFLSVVDQFAGEISGSIIKWFNNLNVISGLEDIRYREFSINKLQQPQGKESVLKFLKVADIDIEDITANVIQIDDDRMRDIPAELQTAFNALKKFMETNKEFDKPKFKAMQVDLQFMHKKFDEKSNFIGMEPLAFDHQSHGTQKIFSLSGPILDTIENGKILVIDELDARLHPLITGFLIDLFHNPSVNLLKSQLIFATHDTQLLGNRRFRRDQVWFTEKDEFGASSLYSLLEFKERKDASFGKEYIAGKYGAIPFLGDFNEIFKGME